MTPEFKYKLILDFFGLRYITSRTNQFSYIIPKDKLLTYTINIKKIFVISNFFTKFIL